MRKTQPPILRRIKKTANNEQGYILIMGIFVLMMLLLMGVALAVMGIQEFDISARTKLMDQAYLIADGGVNAAAVAMETNPTYEQTTTPQYPSDPGIATGTGAFGGGDYTYTIYQSERNATDPAYKVVKSVGTIQDNSGKKVQRVILARIVLGASGSNYDLSFDYLMYNGMDSNGDGVSDGGTWAPTTLRFNATISGNYGYDGASSYLGHSPKGAFYVDGNLQMPVSFAGTDNIQGNIVATGNIELKNTWSVGLLTANYGIHSSNGNIVAGLDGTGNATVDAVNSGGSWHPAIAIDGKVCAPGNVSVTSEAAVNFSSPITIGGIRAGGNTLITSSWSLGAPLQVSSYGIISGQNTTINTSGFIGNSSVNGNISTYPVGGIVADSGLAIFSGTYTGGDVTGQGVSLNANGVGCGINVGNGIRSNGRVDLAAALDSASVTTGKITAGNDSASATGGTGVSGEVKTLSGWILTPSININGQITSAGAVNLASNCVADWFASHCYINTQGIKSGSNSSGLGITLGGNAFGDYSVGSLESVGNITMNNTDGGRISTGWIWSGGNVSMGVAANWATDIGDNSITIDRTKTMPFGTTGALASKGSSTVWSADNVYIQNGDINVVGDLNIKSIKTSILGGNNRVRVASGWTAYVGGTTTILNENKLLDCSAQIGSIRSVGSIDVRNNDPATVGDFYAGNPSNPGSELYFFCDANTFSGDSYGGNMWSANNVHIKHDQNLSGDLYLGTIKSHTYIDMDTAWEASNDTWTDGMWSAGRIDTEDFVGGDEHEYSDPGFPGNPFYTVTPSVEIPSQPSKPASPTVATAGDATTGDVNMLREAGLTAPVKLMRPNWAYFETVAGQDDVANGPNTRICPNCRRTVNSTDAGWPNSCRYCGTDLTDVPVGPAHIIYDGGAGDQDHAVNNIIVFKWDNTTPYSSNEDVYVGDPGVTVQLSVINWSNEASTFQGTMIARGPVVITAPSSSWIIKTGQTLNVVSGSDISNNSSGFALWSQAESNLHLWAAHDINLNNLNISLASGNTFYGSFTAGNQINFADNSIWTNTNFKWSRWGLDPVAWAPPFKVLEWKEI